MAKFMAVLALSSRSRLVQNLNYNLLIKKDYHCWQDDVLTTYWRSRSRLTRG
jgi:hypothetical protein